MAKTILLFSLILLSLLSLSSALPSQAIVDATEILSNSGYVSMALTLELVSSQLRLSQFPTVTLFAPPDSAFVKSGQPPLSVLRLHFSPLAFSFEGLRYLPFGSKIQTMSPGYFLVVTSPSAPSVHYVSVNNVTVNGSPIFDDGSLIIFGIEDFFSSNYTISPPIHNPSPNFECVVTNSNDDGTDYYGDYPFKDACDTLRSRGYSVMSSFLDLQLTGSKDQNMMTVFAPVDEAMTAYVGNYSDYASILLRHVVPCKLSWTDLVNFDNGTVLRTYSDWSTINVTLSGDSDTLMLNGVAVNFPNMYSNDWLVIHGVDDILPVPEVPDSEELSESSDAPVEGNVEKEFLRRRDHGEF